jgi:hypothetical protein
MYNPMWYNVISLFVPLDLQHNQLEQKDLILQCLRIIHIMYLDMCVQILKQPIVPLTYTPHCWKLVSYSGSTGNQQGETTYSTICYYKSTNHCTD